MKVTLLITSILTNDGTYKLHTIDLATARLLCAGNTVESAIGIAQTCDLLTELLGFDVPVNRQQYSQQPGEIALVFRLNARIPEGKVLTREELDEIGYSFKVLERLQ
ncbi:DUF1874 domain-containing protein [Mastigocladus laminosus UU774]|nr:DUF1874 domain-containing protein [Mastigocladus laminosus UU774]